MLSTWETFAKRRFDQGREYEREALAKVIANIEEERAEERKEREALKKRNAELEELLKEKERE